jgi:hypothetical protein
MHEPIGTLIYAGEQTNVDTVVIDGKVVLEGGAFPGLDEEAFVQEVHERALALSQRIGTFRLVKGRRFTPFGYDGAWGKTVRPERSDNGAGPPVAAPAAVEE